MKRRRVLLVGLVAGAALALASAGAAMRPPDAPKASAAAGVAPVPAFSASELTAPAAANWPTVGGNIWNQRYSTLDQINSTNVSGLEQAWRVDLDGSGVKSKYSQEASPVVYNGVMYIPTGNNDIFALDATTGERLWTYKSGINQKISTICCGWDSRGVGLGDGKVFSAQLDGYLVALDAQTGQVVWKVQNVNWKKGETMTMAPTYFDGLVYVGMSGGEFGARGSLTAYNASNGSQAWRFYTCPEPGQFGADTWAGDEYKNCGATVWGNPAIDPELGMLYFTTSNADPWTGRGPGQNLFATSIVALDARTGEYKWHFQQVHHDIWDYDCPSPPALFDTTINGQVRQGIGEACKTGWLYLLDRTNGTPLVGIEEKPVPQNKWANTWPTQPYPIGDAFSAQCAPKAKYRGKAPDGKPYKIGCIFDTYDYRQFVAFAPGALGGNNWPPISFNPQTNLTYICSLNFSNALKAVPRAKLKYQQGKSFTGIEFGVGKQTITTGNFTAMDVRTNRIVWRKDWPVACYSGSVTTAGNLVFVGQDNGKKGGTLFAYDASNGTQLWSATTDAGADAPAITYEVNGKQYVAILAGGSSFVDTRNGPSKHGDSVYAFALPG